MSSSSLGDSFDGLGTDSLPDMNGEGVHVAFYENNSPYISEAGVDEGVAMREWRRENAIRLEEKERREKVLLSQIVAEAEDFRVDFHAKRKASCATSKVSNREKEKILVSSLEKIHAEAEKNYWKTIAELIPHEVPAFINKKEKRGEEKNPSIIVVQGPKPGKPTELSRMRHILLKLKHEAPSHLNLCSTKDAKTGDSDGVYDPVKAATVEAVAVA